MGIEKRNRRSRDRDKGPVRPDGMDDGYEALYRKLDPKAEEYSILYSQGGFVGIKNPPEKGKAPSLPSKYDPRRLP